MRNIQINSLAITTIQLINKLTMYLLLVIIAIILVQFIVHSWLTRLNFKHWQPQVPESVRDVYTSEAYGRAREYQEDNYNLSQKLGFLNLALMLGMLLTGGFGWLDQILLTQFGLTNELLRGLVFFGLIGLVSAIISLPFEWYSTFTIEAKYGFNRSTPKLFFMDKLRGIIISIIIGPAIYYLLYKFYYTAGNLFWLYTWAAVTIFSLFMSAFGVKLFLPLFNKLSPLTDDNLNTSIEQYAKKVQFPYGKILVIDGSKRSTKANAFFTGMGSTRMIVLYDTLLATQTHPETLAVLAHEVGHYKRWHVYKMLLISTLTTGFALFVLGYILNNSQLSTALGAAQHSLHVGLLAFALLYSPISEVLSIISNIWSRKHEFEADDYAKQTYGGEALASALKKLTVTNLGNLTPHPAYVFVHYSHPPVVARLAALAK
ncbi:MAG: M48 family metallopeptidase [Chitinophagales bacterium]|nr:M48 family metallopeptidase [Sphingobacteriales bacterium]MBK6890821.1 M48 family metallopeptidase [Sphingobacteriales bacterium]MBK8677841.1 M48 family metallopeptidase [Sphingobacteriales bacterium]MCC7057269.1 M48 family metallopeptidase [Chitinophagales bacterium]